ncbi:MAG: RecB-like helicase [Campylobacterales bacterium]|nr:RecB-like helicase [Campylobacterales bacterium]
MAFEPFLAYEASAGSGKTFNLVVRYLSLLFMGEDPRSIVALTFTNKAANEMLERMIVTLEHLHERGELAAIAQVCEMSPEEILSRRSEVLRRFLRSDIQISTIDKFFGRILRKFALNAGIMPTFKTTQNHHEVKLLERFLNEVEVAGASDALVHLSRLSDKRLSDLFLLLSQLYSKHKELDLDGYAGVNVVEEAIEEAMAAAAELKTLVLGKGLSDTANRAIEAESFELLLKKTWLYQPSLNYWVFKKGFEPRMDEVLARIQAAVKRHFRRREGLYFKELFTVLKLYIKSRKVMAVQNNELSFDDITLMVHTLLREKLESEFLYFRLDSHLKHLLLDEFQDTSVLQFDILRPLIEEIRSGIGVNEGGSFFFVGDVKQSIYRFRGGVSALFHQVAEYFNVHIEPLRVNYRSRSTIVEFVNRAFGGKIAGYTPQMSPEKLSGGYVAVAMSDDLLETLSRTVASLIDQGVQPEEIAVLTVTNKDGSAVEEHLSLQGYDVVTETTARLVSQHSVRAVIEYLRYCYFDVPIYRFNCAALIGLSPDQIERHILADPVEGAIAFIRRYEIADKSVLMFVEALRGYRDLEEVVFEIDRLEASSPQSDLRGIRIMTVHKSKGLEFEHVIVLDQLGKPRAHNDPIVYEYEGAQLQRLYYRIKDREVLDSLYAEALAKEKKASAEDRLNALYVALTRAVESLWVITKEKSSWFAPLELTPAEWGRLEKKEAKAKSEEIQRPLIYRARRFGRQEESVSAPKEATHDYAAVQFGLALHYTLEMMGSFTEEAMGRALESARNRYGAVLHPGAMEEIASRVLSLIQDPTFASLCAGEWRKEQMIRYQGSINVIDLLVRHGDEWVIIDYKSGREEEQKHREQVGRYVEAIAALSGQKASGYLCYLLPGGVEWVKCL